MKAREIDLAKYVDTPTDTAASSMNRASQPSADPSSAAAMPANPMLSTCTAGDSLSGAHARARLTTAASLGALTRPCYQSVIARQ